MKSSPYHYNWLWKILYHLQIGIGTIYERANKLYYIKQHFLQGVMFNTSLVLISILRSTMNDILSKFHSVTKVWSLLIYIVSLRIIQ